MVDKVIIIGLWVSESFDVTVEIFASGWSAFHVPPQRGYLNLSVGKHSSFLWLGSPSPLGAGVWNTEGLSSELGHLGIKLSFKGIDCGYGTLFNIYNQSNILDVKI